MKTDLKDLASIRLERVLNLLDLDRQTLRRLLDDPESGFPVPFRIKPASAKSHLRIRVRELEAWVRKQQRLTSQYGGAGGIQMAGKAAIATA